MSRPFYSVRERATPGGVKCGQHKIRINLPISAGKRARLERHLVAKYVTNAKPHGRPPYWELSIETEKEDSSRGAEILLSVYLKTLHVIKAGQWHLKA